MLYTAKSFGEKIETVGEIENGTALKENAHDNKKSSQPKTLSAIWLRAKLLGNWKAMSCLTWTGPRGLETQLFQLRDAAG